MRPESKIVKIIEVESRMTVARGWRRGNEEMVGKGCKVSVNERGILSGDLMMSNNMTIIKMVLLYT